ncbi:tyrosine-type recombinase/integrase [Paenibacillus ehimensis]|nr:tyrosine-type recombinase/integrase [Paenibacillus ehimensis]
MRVQLRNGCIYERPVNDRSDVWGIPDQRHHIDLLLNPNEASIRKVSIGDSVIKALKSQLAWREQKIKNGEVVHNSDFIFFSIYKPGYPASAKWVWDRFTKYVKLAGLPKNLTPHSLRHTHVTLLAEAGEQLAVIQERLGHKNDEITKRIYLHVTAEQRKAIPDRFEMIMSS